MASIASAEFKRIFGLKRSHEGQLTSIQKNNERFAVLELGVSNIAGTTIVQEPSNLGLNWIGLHLKMHKPTNLSKIGAERYTN